MIFYPIKKPAIKKGLLNNVHFQSPTKAEYILKTFGIVFAEPQTPIELKRYVIHESNWVQV